MEQSKQLSFFFFTKGLLLWGTNIENMEKEEEVLVL